MSLYQNPLKHYEQIYGVSYRTILRWAAKNLPLDDEQATRDIVSASKGTADGGGAIYTRAEDAPRGPLGLSASIQRLQEAEEAAHAEYEAARAEGVPIAISHAIKRWTGLVEQLRKVEQTSPEVQEANKSTIRLDDLQMALNDLFGKLRQDLETLPGRISKELVGKDEIATREALTRETGEIIQSLYACKYLVAADE